MNARNHDTVASLLSDKRLLSITEFCTYASVGRNRARDLAETADAVFRVGRRVMIDRIKFDKFCDENTMII